MMHPNQDEDTTVLLNELREISNKYSSRNHAKITQGLSKQPKLYHENVQRDFIDQRKQNEFLLQTGENSNLNQYWYSKTTIDTLCNAIRESCDISDGKRVAFLSTPSLFFSMTEEERESCALFDVSTAVFLIGFTICSFSSLYQFDTSWSTCQGYHFYDYNKPTSIPDSRKKQFDLVVIDPPFITQSVWELYAIAAKLLLKSDTSHVIATTVDENADLMMSLFHCKPALFRPSIPHLVYQYSVYANFESETLSRKNEELDY